jgi:hypothetical protein
MKATKVGNIRLPPGCGADLSVPLLHNPYQQSFQSSRRLRHCLNCKTTGSMDELGNFTCAKCKVVHVSNLTAPRVFDRFLVLAGRGGGKTLIGAHAAREEMSIPNSIGWVMSDTYKRLHDSTFPTLVRLIPPHWVAHWDQEHMEIKLINGALVAFRSLEDPERARGPHGVSWGWFDEAAQCPERAYHVFTPTLIKAAGIVICTTTVLGFDWTYDQIEKPAIANEPGYWFTKYWTEENPLFRSNPVMMREIERARARMSPDFYDQEYRAERRIATGLIYPYKIIEDQTLTTDDEVRKILPEWPNIDSTRQVLIGLDSGADHPFGAVMIVVTEQGLVIVGEYLERMQAISQHLSPIRTRFGLDRFTPDNITWAANKNEANLRLEWGLKGVGVQPAESKHEVGIQRVNSWLHTKQLFFVKSRCSITVDQMKTYRYADNVAPDGQKKKEQVFKQKDELPDSVRYALMAFPELPEPNRPQMTDREQRRWDAMDERTRQDVERVREFSKRERKVEDFDESRFGQIGEFFNPWDETGPAW